MEREKQPKQQQDQTQSSQSPREIALTESPKIAPTNDRLKRDEWSEGSVSCLLEAYEAKWTLRNRAKLKGHDWEDVARHVSARSNGSKTQTQCKNKIESMKKRYRSESAAADASSWPLYHRLDLLLRGNGGLNSGAASIPPAPVAVVDLPSVVAVSPALPPPVAVSPALPPPVAEVVAAAPVVLEVAQKSHGTNDGDRLGKDEGDGTNNGVKVVRNQESEKNPIDDSDSSTPPIDHFQKEKPKATRLKKKNIERKDHKPMKRAREEYLEIGESIRWLAEVVVRSEQTRMETMKEIERMRAEAEAKRGEMDLKRTEIIANTQLQIAKLFAKGLVEDWKKPT